ncbi:MAG: Ig-like domain-containing protein, partial [Bacteroidota bacterium]
YSICDKTNPSVCDTAKVTVTITPAPVANPDTITATAGVLKNIPILTNDKNPDGTPVIDLTKITTPIIATAPTKGIAVVKADGSIDYTPNSGTSGTDTFIYTICDIANSSVCDTAKVTLTIEVPPINKVCLLPKAYLQGALLGVLLPNTLMRDDLRVKGLIPTSSPYTSGITTTGVIASSVLSVTGADAIVDWVFVELRSGLDSTVIVDSRSALIQRDGDIVDVDGVGSVKFTEANAGQYYVVVKHRNHLGVMSFKTQMDNTCAIIDFRNVSTPNYNFNVNNAINLPQVDVEQGKALWAGNVLYDNNVIFQGTGNDVNVIYQQVINASGNFFVSPSYILKGYYSGDIDLNGATIFQGTGNDIEFIYKNVIKNHPGNIFKLNSFKIKAQIP